MIKRFAFVFIAFCLFVVDGKSQNAQAMRNFEAQISQQMELVYNAVTDNRRYLASETAAQLLQEALSTEVHQLEMELGQPRVDTHLARQTSACNHMARGARQRRIRVFRIRTVI